MAAIAGPPLGGVFTDRVVRALKVYFGVNKALLT